MKNITLFLLGIALITSPLIAQATPEEDLQAFRSYFQKRFPKVEMDDYSNGVYSIDAASRAQWEEIEEFPPYEIQIDEGEELYNKTFANGKSYADCFNNAGKSVKQNYPFFDTATGKIITFEGAINQCREANGEKAFKWKKGKLAALSAYMAYTSRGEKVNIQIPDDPKALAAYTAGKKFFYAKRGQLNMSCADCHVYYAGNRIRAEILSPALGQTTGFPVYRSAWGGMGTLHRRYDGCISQIRAKPFKAQSDEYKNLEYFQAYMSNGLPMNGPSSRK